MFSIYQTKADTHARRVRMPETHPANGKKLAHPAARAPRIFADTATFPDIEPLYRAGIISGVTTNPTLMKKAGAKSWDHAKQIARELINLVKPNPVLLELIELTEAAMVRQAQELAGWGDNVVIKVPVGGYQAVDPSFDPYTGLKVINTLWKKDIRCCATLVFSSTQALWAAQAGACYIAPFLGRLADYAYKHDISELTPGNSLYWIQDHKNDKDDQHVANSEYVASGGPRKDIGPRLIQEISAIFTNYDIHTEILAASFRNFSQLTECLLAGADILTVPANILTRVAEHPLTSEGMARFFEDSKVFDKPAAEKAPAGVKV
jgi:transaldolase